MWKGDQASQRAIHEYLRNHYPKTGTCEECGEDVGTAFPTGTHYAFKHHPEQHTRNREDYRELCRSCHIRADEHVRPRSSDGRWDCGESV